MRYSKKLKKKYKIVIDANVIISSIFGGYPEKTLEISMLQELFAPLRLKEELEGFLKRIRKRQDFPNLEAYFTYVLNHTNLVFIKDPERICRDRSDDFYIAVAIQKEVDFLVTGDKDILSCKDLREWPFKILTPKEFVELVGRDI